MNGVYSVNAGTFEQDERGEQDEHSGAMWK
jgi:hypothetical protein